MTANMSSANATILELGMASSKNLWTSGSGASSSRELSKKGIVLVATCKPPWKPITVPSVGCSKSASILYPQSRPSCKCFLPTAGCKMRTERHTRNSVTKGTRLPGKPCTPERRQANTLLGSMARDIRGRRARAAMGSSCETTWLQIFPHPLITMIMHQSQSMTNSAKCV